MDGTITFTSLLAIASAIITIGGAWLTIRKLSKDFRKERELERAKILQEAKEAAAKVKAELVAAREIQYQDIAHQLKGLQIRQDNLEQSVEKEFLHIRETYNGALSNLSDKIEDLRTELRNQHGQLVSLLSEMIRSRD